MRHGHAGIDLLFVLLVATAGCEVEPGALELTPEDRDAIEAMGQQVEQAVLDRDWETLFALFHEDAVVMPPDHPRVEGLDAIRVWWLDAVEEAEYPEFSVETVEVEGRGNLAYARHQFRVSVAERGEDAEVVERQEGDWLWILRRDAEAGWLIHREIWNRTDPPEALEAV